MPRNGSNVYSKPAGTAAVSGETVESADYNATIDDLVTDANTARPIVAGGTGATTAAGAIVNLGLDGEYQPLDPILTGFSDIDLAGLAGEVFKVNDTEDAPETLPIIIIPDLAGNAGKNLAVNLAETGVEYVDPGSPGSRVQIGTAVDLAGLQFYDFTGFDAARFVGYEIELINMDQGSNGGLGLAWRTSIDAGVSFDDGASDYQIHRSVNGAAPIDTTGSEAEMFTGLSSVAGEYANATLRLMRPDQNVTTVMTGDYSCARSSGIDTATITARRVAAQVVNAIQIDKRAGSTSTWVSGTAYFYGILA